MNGLLSSLIGGGFGYDTKKKEDEWRNMYGVPDMSRVDGPQSPMSVGQKPEKLSWEDGGKLGWKDALALALTGVGDAFTREGGGEGGALSEMMGRAMNARAASRKAQIDAAKEEAQRQKMMQVGLDNGLSAPQVEAQMYGLNLPQPEKPDELTRQMIAGGIDPNSEEGRNTYRQIVMNRADPVVVMQGGGWAGPRSQIPGMQPPPPPKKISLEEFNAAPEAPQANVPSGNPLSGSGGYRPPSKVISTAQFQQEVRRRGVAGASQWLQENNISIRN
jgi:hypothetical protein